jgi:hypothetical protein
MNNPLSRIVNTLPVDFFRSLEEEIVVSFGQALHVTNQQYEAPERKAMLAQNRHALCEAAFRRVANMHGLEAYASDTNPKGGVFSWAGKDNLFLLRGNIQNHCGTPRPTKFRRQWSTVNEWLSPLQFNLLDETPEPSSDGLCAMLVVSAHKSQHGDSSIPAFIGIGVPSSNLSSWKVLKPISDILALYHDMDAEQKAPREAIVEIRDHAIPVLKKRSDKNGA